MLVNSQEYAGTMLREGEFILQAIGSKFEMLAMTECECIYYRFVQPELFCDLRFNHIMKEVSPPLIYSKYTNGFQCFVIQNYKKVKTVEELAQLGGYTISTFRRIFNSVFHEPVYEWMLARRKEGILDDLLNTDHSISEICYKYGFESLPHFSNFCKKSFGASPRNLRR